MSATGRGSERHENDEYLTPAYCVKRFLEAYRIPAGIVLDPCAARGELLNVVWNVRRDCTPVGIELRPECLPALQEVCGLSAAATEDFLTVPPSDGVACVMTNFPFSLAEKFLLHSLKFAPIVITLQRINWIRGDERHRLMNELKPGLFVLPERPSFNGWGTDSTEYCFYVFGDPAVAGRWFVLGETPVEERAAWNKKMKAIYPKPEKKGKAA